MNIITKQVREISAWNKILVISEVPTISALSKVSQVSTFNSVNLPITVNQTISNDSDKMPNNRETRKIYMYLS